MGPYLALSSFGYKSIILNHGIATYLVEIHRYPIGSSMGMMWLRNYPRIIRRGAEKLTSQGEILHNTPSLNKGKLALTPLKICSTNLASFGSCFQSIAMLYIKPAKKYTTLLLIQMEILQKKKKWRSFTSSFCQILSIDKYEIPQVTPYNHLMPYHIPFFIKSHGRFKKFSGKGLEKNNIPPIFKPNSGVDVLVAN